MKMKKLPILVMTLPLILAGCTYLEPSSSSSSASSGTAISPSSEISTSVETSISTSASTPWPGPVRKNVQAKTVGHYEGAEILDSAVYDDSWFFKDSKTINYELAAMSALAEGAAGSRNEEVSGANIVSAMEAMGFTDIKKNLYFESNIYLENSFGVIMGKKWLQDENGKNYTLIGIFTRCDGYKDEWVGNFNLGVNGLHEGFKQGRDEVLRFLKKYIADSSITGDLKIWAAGYSRAGGVANLLGGFLAEDNGYFGNTVHLDPKDLYVYTIGTPSTVPTSVSKADALSVSGPRGLGFLDTNVPAYTYQGEGNIDLSDAKFSGIHNFTAIGDIVTTLPPEEWNFTRFGLTEKILYGEEGLAEQLSHYSEDAAKRFDNGRTFNTEVAKKALDFKTLTIIDTDEKAAPPAIFKERLDRFMNEVGSRKALVDEGYTAILGAGSAIFATDAKGFLAGVTGNLNLAVKAALGSLLAYVVDQTKLSDAEAVVEVIRQFLGKTKEEIASYTDQQFLADILDFAINDYQSKPEGKARAESLAKLLPAPYNDVLIGLLDYAKANNLTPKTVDGFVELLARYVTDNRQNPTIIALVEAVIKMVPAEYASYISILGAVVNKDYSDITDINEKNKAAVLDLFEAFAKGTFDKEGKLVLSAEDVRGTVINLASQLLLSDSPRLVALIQNGLHNDSGEIKKEAQPLTDIIEDVLNHLFKGKEEEKRKDIAACADAAIVALLNQCKTLTNASYIEELIKGSAKLRKAFPLVAFNPGETFDLYQDVSNAITLIDTLSFLMVGHFHETYLSYFRSKIPA